MVKGWLLHLLLSNLPTLLLPLSFLWDCCMFWRVRWRYLTRAGARHHSHRVQAVQAQVSCSSTELA